MANQIPISVTARRPNLNSLIEIDERWKPEEINEEYENLQDIIDNQLIDALLDTETAQTIVSQKTFTNLYMTNGDEPSYESVMDVIQNDISPVWGTGAKALISNDPKEFSFSRNNVAGVIAPIAGRNPCFIKSNIQIKKEGSFIFVDATNVPLAAYDSSKSGIPPATNSTYVQPYYWPTSVSFIGGLDLSDSYNIIGGLSNDTRYEIILAYRDDVGLTNCFIVKDGSEGGISNAYKSFRRIGFFRYKNGFDDNFEIKNGVFIPNHTWALPASNFGNPSSVLSSFAVGVSGYIKNTCIIEIATIPSGLDTTIQFDTQPIHVIAGNPINYYLKRNQTIKIPMVWQSNQFVNTFATPANDNQFFVRRVIFGHLG